MKALKQDDDFQKMMTDKGIKKNYLEEASKKWNEMSESQKLPYVKENQKMKDQYEIYQQ